MSWIPASRPEGWSSVTLQPMTPHPSPVQPLLNSRSPGHLLPVMPQASPIRFTPFPVLVPGMVACPSSSLRQPALIPSSMASPALALPASLSSCPGFISSPYNLGTSCSLSPSFPSSPPFQNHSFAHTIYFSGTPSTPPTPRAHGFLGRKIPCTAFKTLDKWS